MLEFKPGDIPEETVLEIKPGRALCEQLHENLIEWLMKQGQGCWFWLPGEWNSNTAWADLLWGRVEVDCAQGLVRLVFTNQPEGDDRLDGGHPHWTAPHEHMWLVALPRVRQILLNGRAT